MIKANNKIAVFFGDQFGASEGKMGYGVMRYSPHHIVCAVDTVHAGKQTDAVVPFVRSYPIVASISEAIALGADVLVLGTAPSGGLLPPAWQAALDEAVASGLSIVNGLHDPLAPKYPNLKDEQWIWDIRKEPTGVPIASGQAATLPNKRVLIVGSDMAVGKMTAGLELFQLAKQKGIKTEFLATGQIGMSIMGKGIPLDAIRVDWAPGAVEQMVMAAKDADLTWVEGQGSLVHPGSSVTLALIRGACPTHFVFCHRALMTKLEDHNVTIPSLRDLIALYEDLAAVCGAFKRPKTIGITLNTSHLSAPEAEAAIAELREETGYFVTDVVRYGAEGLLNQLV